MQSSSSSSSLSSSLLPSYPSFSNHVVLFCCIFVLHCWCCSCWCYCCHWCAVIIAIMLHCCSVLCVLLFLFFVLLVVTSMQSSSSSSSLSFVIIINIAIALPFLLLSWGIVVLHCCLDVGAFVHDYFGGIVLFWCFIDNLSMSLFGVIYI